MELIIDASILFTALVGTGVTKDIIFSKDVTLYAPEYLFEEFAEHRARIEKLSGLSAKDFDSLLETQIGSSRLGPVAAATWELKLVIKQVPKERFEGFRKEAHKTISAEDDTEYVALSLSMDKVPVWSNDIHFKKQSVIKAFNTAELVLHLKSSGKTFR